MYVYMEEKFCCEMEDRGSELFIWERKGRNGRELRRVALK